MSIFIILLITISWLFSIYFFCVMANPIQETGRRYLCQRLERWGHPFICHGIRSSSIGAYYLSDLDFCYDSPPLQRTNLDKNRISTFQLS